MVYTRLKTQRGSEGASAGVTARQTSTAALPDLACLSADPALSEVNDGQELGIKRSSGSLGEPPCLVWCEGLGEMISRACLTPGSRKAFLKSHTLLRGSNPATDTQSQPVYSDHREPEVRASLLLPSWAQHRPAASASYLVSQAAK